MPVQELVLVHLLLVGALILVRAVRVAVQPMIAIVRTPLHLLPAGVPSQRVGAALLLITAEVQLLHVVQHRRAAVVVLLVALAILAAVLLVAILRVAVLPHGQAAILVAAVAVPVLVALVLARLAAAVAAVEDKMIGLTKKAYL